jgi:glycosyltransferase involved in cell wall biosynthesis
MRVLVTTPPLVVPPRGACEHDRASGVKQLVRLGHDVRVLSFRFPWQECDREKSAAYLGADVELLPYQPVPPHSPRAIIHRVVAALRRPALLDGSAMVYTHPEVVRPFDELLDHWHPDVAWFDYTNLWPLVERARDRGVATVVRSINYEPQHNLEERGRSLANRGRYFAKYLSERASMRAADAFAAITPADRREYLRLGRTDCGVLPLRSLSSLLRASRPVRVRQPLEVFFFGSNYSVSHNRAALLFILRDVVPGVRAAAPGAFRFNLLGSKPPADLESYLRHDVRLNGFVTDLESFLDTMDIALVPSLYGGGMQQKIFEPLCRAFPCVIAPRGLAAYPVRDGQHALLATSGEDMIAALLRLRDPGLRERLSSGASAFGAEHFNQSACDAVVIALLEAATKSRTVS